MWIVDTIDNSIFTFAGNTVHHGWKGREKEESTIWSKKVHMKSYDLYFVVLLLNINKRKIQNIIKCIIMSKVTAECNLSFHPQSIQIGEIFSFGSFIYIHKRPPPASVLNENFAEVQVNNCCWWMFGKVFMIDPKVKL